MTVINPYSDVKMLVLAVGFWATLVWTEKHLARETLNPWDKVALMAGSFVSTIGACVSTLLFLSVGFSLLIFHG